MNPRGTARNQSRNGKSRPFAPVEGILRYLLTYLQFWQQSPNILTVKRLRGINHLPGGQEIAGSNPVGPTNSISRKSCKSKTFGFFCFMFEFFPNSAKRNKTPFCSPAGKTGRPAGVPARCENAGYRYSGKTLGRSPGGKG